jgi:hypothetical protein
VSLGWLLRTTWLGWEGGKGDASGDDGYVLMRFGDGEN